MNWVKKAKEEGLPISGDYLNITEGVTYLLRFTEIENEEKQDIPSEEKDMKGNLRSRYTFHVELIGIQEKKAFVKVIEGDLKKNPGKKDKLDNLKENLQKEYIFKMSKTCRYHLADFVEKEDLKNGETFSFQRIGNSTFLFEKIGD